MASRVSPPDSLEFFPTPPWATRALFEHVLPRAGVKGIRIVRDPACGQGHMAEVCREYAGRVIRSDIFDYGVGADVFDYLNVPQDVFEEKSDLVIYNPPFKLAASFVERTLFAERAIIRTSRGLCMFMRTQWLEGAERYGRIFRDYPPTVFAPFVERVPIVEGRWDPDASTATSYAWFCWVHGADPLPVFWIPGGCKERLARPEDRARFAAWSLQPDDDSELKKLARELCAADKQNANAEIATMLADTRTYRERRAIGSDDLRKRVKVPRWMSRRREADNLIAMRVTSAALRIAA